MTTTQDGPSGNSVQDAYEHHKAGRFADAARVYQALLARDPDDIAALHLFGVLHQQCGYPARAADLIARAVALRPEVASIRSNLAEAYRSLKLYEQAAASCRKALELQPDFPEAANNLGLVLHDMGRFEEAVGQFDAALVLRPDDATVQNNRGTSLLSLGRADEALEAFRAALRLDPNLALARANLGQLLTDRDQPAEGLPHCQEAVRLQPDLPAARNNLGNALLALGRWEEARGAYAEAVRLEPGLAVAQANLGLTLQHEGKVAEALPYLRLAADLAPGNPTFHRQLAVAYGLVEQWAESVASCERRAAIEPDSADAQSDLGWACQCAERHADAEAAYRRALGLQPNHLDAWLNLGGLQEERGEMTDAEASYREAEARHPDSPLPLARRAVLARGRVTDEDRDRLRFHLYSPVGALPRMEALYALAQVADARGDFPEAAACLGPANALARRQRQGNGQSYDPDEHARYVDRLIAGFTPALFERLSGGGDQTERPVFVFGMPRSGTTLVEQVLASHGLIHGAGELPLVRRAMDSLPPTPAGSQDPLASSLQALDVGTLRRLADAYTAGVDAKVAIQSPGANPGRVVDKLPDNYLYLGLIALMFPRATLIYVRRDLRDVAVSCWMTQFRSIRWADDEGDLARRCRDHVRLMRHWREVLPRTVHEVNYEALVDDFEAGARRLVAACGLEWDPACLKFHKTNRTVRTASVGQVRQPIYRKSLARWKAYEPHLSTLFDLIPRQTSSDG
ncbi:tetratricopeptide repeat protein [Tundrisphaera lichenicola]|uniref:tetratricopeptide repeat protein n=1 Tax=Tundrisphaera lichenicola TaxID=2029860 RepID=UPI003EBD3DD2